MEERTADEVAAIFKAAGDSVTVINGNKATGESDADWKDTLQRNVDHLETIKAYKKVDGTTSIWTSESFTAIDAAVTSGKSKIGALWFHRTTHFTFFLPTPSDPPRAAYFTPCYTIYPKGGNTRLQALDDASYGA